MNRKKFLRGIKKKLRGLPKSEITRLIDYFDESISERMERGMTEEAAVAALGSPEDAAGNVIREMPDNILKSADRRSVSKRVMQIFVVICASPILISLIAVAFSVAIALLAVYISAVTTLFVGAAGCFAGALGCAALMFIEDKVGLLMGIGAACICAGLAVLFGICGKAVARAGIRAIAACCRAGKRKRVTA